MADQLDTSSQRPPFDDSFSIVQIAKMDARWLREQLGCGWAATTIDGLLAELERTEGDLAVAIREATTARAALAEANSIIEQMIRLRQCDALAAAGAAQPEETQQ